MPQVLVALFCAETIMTQGKASDVVTGAKPQVSNQQQLASKSTDTQKIKVAAKAPPPPPMSDSEKSESESAEKGLQDTTCRLKC